jgi:transposase
MKEKRYRMSIKKIL